MEDSSSCDTFGARKSLQNRDCGGLVVAATLDNDTPRKGLTRKMVQVQCGLLTITTGFLIVYNLRYEIFNILFSTIV